MAPENEHLFPDTWQEPLVQGLSSARLSTLARTTSFRTRIAGTMKLFWRKVLRSQLQMRKKHLTFYFKRARKTRLSNIVRMEITITTNQSGKTGKKQLHRLPSSPLQKTEHRFRNRFNRYDPKLERRKPAERAGGHQRLWRTGCDRSKQSESGG